MTRINTLAALAALMGLTPAQAVALPVTVTVSARKVGMTEAAMIAELAVNAPLRKYLAEVCATAAKAA